MKKTFGNRLFRLFLIFSISPALVLAIFGYYLTSQTGVIEEDLTTRPGTRISGYYNELLRAEVDKGISGYRDSGRVESDFVDFVFVLERNDIREVLTHDLLTPPVMRSIIEASSERECGFVSQKGRYFQFSSQRISSKEVIYGGFVHDESYGELMTAIQEDYAQQSLARALRPEFLFFLSLLFVTIAAVTIFLAWYFSARISRNLARPLTELSVAARRISEGDFDQRIEPSGDEEFQALIRNFNHMAAQLSQTTARLAQSERVAAWRQVARRFAHELKNPIQPILVSLYRIEKKLYDTEAYDIIYEPLKAASEELKHLTRLAERFSELAKLPEPSIEKVNLGDLVKSVVDLYQQQLAAFGFQLIAPGETVTVDGDPAYIREALHNIIQNAVDASSNGSRIILTLSADDCRASLALQDFGDGMDPETVASSRLPYFTTKEKGNGLGLAIVEKSISEMHGDLHVESRKGHGTTVTISLPLEGRNDAGENSDS